jgi:murein DD-endopeptidase MepM/ murein hydrolase activator NlpD
MRRLMVSFALLAGALIVPAVATSAASSDSAAEQAAQEIAAARNEANAAAQAWEEAKVELEQLTDEEAAVQREQDELQGKVDELSVTVQQVAINRFVSGSTGGVPLLSGLSGPNDQAQAEVFTAIANDNSAAQLNEWDVASDELDAKQEELASAQERTKRAQEQLAARQREAEELVVHLQEVEEQRLKDEAVRRELERIQAEQRAKEAAEQEAREAAAEREAQAQAIQSAVPQAAGPARGGGADDSPAPAPTQPAATQPADDNDDEGDDEESPSDTQPPATEAPALPEPEDFADGSLACPAPGTAFGDTWGAARSGGRRHEGVDMIGPRGTPLYAVTSGSVQFKQTSLGGNSAWVNGDNGDRYFYAHLDSFEGSSRSVGRGELIGYMGATGNANGTNHLHFEVHPGGGAAVNPYPTVRAIC